MTPEEYHAHPALSATKIKDASTGTMLDYWAKHIDPLREPFQPTEAMRQGSLVDCLITEPEHFDERYAILPKDAPQRPTSAQFRAKKPAEETVRRIDWWLEFADQAKGREVVSSEWHETALAIVVRLQSDPDIGPILAMPRSSQEPHFWTDEQGRECRYKPDLEPEDGSLWDLKKARSAHPRKFKWQALDLGYDIQIGAHYRLGFADRHGQLPTQSGFIVYEWDYPHNCSLITCTSAFIDYGTKRRSEALQKIEDCLKTGVWPSFGKAEIDAAATQEPLELELF